MAKRILVTGSLGQIGSELIPYLAEKYGDENIIRVDIGYPSSDYRNHKVDVMDRNALGKIIKDNQINEVYHLAAILSANGEKNPDLAWNVNMDGLRNILELAKEYKFKLFWPSSIAAFGPTTPRDKTPQFTVTAPTTMYGLTKVSGELLCQYYYLKHQVDVRSLRFPGLISYVSPPGGGTSDYAVDIFYHAVREGHYDCFVNEDTTIPMMYMPDALKAVDQLMSTDDKNITIRTSYNLAALSFSAQELADEINKHTKLTVTYKPDFRQQIADSWPRSIDDSHAKKDWGWEHEYNLSKVVEEMLKNIQAKLNGQG